METHLSKTVQLAREAGWTSYDSLDERFKAFEALVRADERNLWPAEMEAMERQVNILTDALAAEREACAKVCDEWGPKNMTATSIAEEIRARGKHD
jgi:hypothetical protein